MNFETRPSVAETDQHRSLCDSIYTQIPEQRTLFVITIDGMPMAGKSTLARYLSWQLQMTALELDVFRDVHQESPFVFRLHDLSRAIEARSLRDRGVIVEGVTVQDVLYRLAEEVGLRVPVIYKVFVVHTASVSEAPVPELIKYFDMCPPSVHTDFKFVW